LLATPDRLTASPASRLRRTVELVERRGYALPPRRVGELCLEGPLGEREVLAAVASSPDLEIVEGLVVAPALATRAAELRRRQEAHAALAPAYRAAARRFAVRLAALFPFVLAVSIAGSLASGGFRETDDVDLNLVVEDGRKHLAYLAVNALGVLDALRYRGKPVDALTARPVAPRVMTLNLVLERSQCFPLVRTDAGMAYELLAAEPVVGAALIADVVAANPRLGEHFPQLLGRSTPLATEPRRRAPRHLYPALLERPARVAGRAAWRYMQWTRRNRPDALARVAYVRATMAPYQLFPEVDA
jgi:predicted nucleotidyltransferase